MVIAPIDARAAELSQAWPPRRAPVTLAGREPSPLDGTFEIPAALATDGFMTRRVDRTAAGHSSFTIVEEPWSGRGFVGVWDAHGTLAWAPRGATDLRWTASGSGLFVLVDTWIEKYAWPSRSLEYRFPLPVNGLPTRFTLSPDESELAILSYVAAGRGSYLRTVPSVGVVDKEALVKLLGQRAE